MVHAVRDMFLENLDEATAELQKDSISDDAVHEVRRVLKRARAILRLLRKCIGPRRYRRGNVLIRDAARPLTALRDAKVLVRTFNQVARNSDDDEMNAFGSDLRRLLRHERRASRGGLSRRNALAAAADLQRVKRRIAKIPKPQLNRVAMLGGLGLVYKTGRKAFAQVREEPTDERLHEWRKQVKYMLNQIDVVRLLGVPQLKGRRNRLHRLADLLGEDHDLAVLNSKISQFTEHDAPQSRADSAHDWTARINGRRSALQRQAYPLGNRLYRKSTRRFKALLDECLSRRSRT